MTNEYMIELSAESIELLESVKGIFKEITGKEEVTNEDVLVTLMAGFMEWVNQQSGWCCGDESDCCSDNAEKDCCSTEGSCSGNCAC